MSFESRLDDNILELRGKVRERERLVSEASGDDCMCECSKCVAVHGDYDEDEVDELKEQLQVWKRELQLLEGKQKQGVRE